MKFLKPLLIFISIFATVNAAAASDLTQNIRNFQVLNSQISTSGTIGGKGYKALANDDFDIIIDARTPPEGTAAEKMRVEALGMTYYNLPIGNSIPSSHLSALDKILAQNKSKKILIHCVSANRAGGLWADYQIAKGANPKTALAAGRKMGMGGRLENWIKNKYKISN